MAHEALADAVFRNKLLEIEKDSSSAMHRSKFSSKRPSAPLSTHPHAAMWANLMLQAWMQVKKQSSLNEFLCSCAVEAAAAFRRGYELWFTTSDSVLQPLTVGSDGDGNSKLRSIYSKSAIRQEASRAFEEFKFKQTQTAVESLVIRPRKRLPTLPTLPVVSSTMGLETTTPPTPVVSPIAEPPKPSPATPVHVKCTNSAYRLFLESPSRPLRLSVPPPPVETVHEAIRESRLVAGRAGSIQQMGSNDDFVAFCERYRFFDVYGDGTDPPLEFKRLCLEQLGKGSFNSVWAPSRASTMPGIVELFPESIRERVRSRDIVFRIPLAKVEPGTVQEVAEEMINLLEADSGHFGVRVIVLAHRRCGLPSEIEEGAVEPRMQLVSVLGKATGTCLDRIRGMQTRVSAQSCLGGLGSKQVWNDAALADYFLQLQRVVWKMSIRGIVHLDATLTNFMDMEFSSGRLSVVGTDLDPLWYRRMKAFDASKGSRAWLPVWYYNILFVSCRVRSTCSPELWEHWMTPSLRHAITSAQEELKGLDRHKAPEDMQHYLQMLDVMEWRLTGPHCGFNVGSNDVDEIRGPEADVVGAMAVEMCRFYNVEAVYRVARKSCLEPLDAWRRRLKMVPSNSAEAAQATREIKSTIKWFDDFFRIAQIPMLRLFSLRVDYNQTDPNFQSCKLHEVLFEYAMATQETLVSVFLEGVRADAKTGYRCARVKCAGELTYEDLQRPLPTLGYLVERKGWRGDKFKVMR